MAQHGKVLFSLAAKDAAGIRTANQIKHPLDNAHKRLVTTYCSAKDRGVPPLPAHIMALSAVSCSVHPSLHMRHAAAAQYGLASCVSSPMDRIYV